MTADLDRVERELEALVAQSAGPDVPAWAALLSQRHRLLMRTSAARPRLEQSQDLTRRIEAYLRSTRAEDSAQLAALQRTAALHQAMRMTQAPSDWSVEG